MTRDDAAFDSGGVSTALGSRRSIKLGVEGVLADSDHAASFVADLIALAALRCEVLISTIVKTREKEASYGLVAGL